MEIRMVTERKKDYLPLLLMADEEEAMIDRYLSRGVMYVLDDEGMKTVCVVTEEGNGVLELKNLATVPACRRRGYARLMIDFLVQTYRGRYTTLQVGTGDSPLTLPFYEKCGFRRVGVIPDFFTKNYSHPIFECGKQLVDMIYLARELSVPADTESGL